MKLKFVSSNIRFNTPNDGENAWPLRKGLLCELIQEHSPDFIATQEGRQPQLLEMSALLQDHDLVDQHRDWMPQRMYPCLFFHEQKYQLLDSGDIWLSETPHVPGSTSFGSAFPRLCTWARFQKEQYQFFVVNVHLDHVKEETRLKQIEVLLTQVKKLLLKEDHLILAGDFNTSPHGQVRDKISKSFSELYDPWENFSHPEETSFHHFNDDFNDGKRIDWVLLDKRIQPIQIFLDKRKPQGRFPSDHYPLIFEGLLK